MAREPEHLIYAPAKRGGFGVLLMIAGPSGSGKTLSALRVATGLANGGPIYFCDTEHGRARIYADDFSFYHLELKEPFNPARFEAAAVVAQRAGSAVWICDSFSHEHVGPGGVLDMFETELTRLTKGDESKRDQLKYAAWIKPKVEHKHLLQRLWQLNCHIILCCHGEKKLELIRNEKGKMVPNPDTTPTAVCSPDIPFAMTASFILDLKRPGVPGWLKHLDKLDPLVPLDRPLDEDTGRRIGAWARPAAAPPRAAAVHQPPPAEPPPPQDGPPQDGPPQDGPPPPQDGPPPGWFPGDPWPPGTAPAGEPPAGGELPLGGPPPSRRPSTRAVFEELIARFEAVKVRADHLAIVDDKTNRERVTWLKKTREKHPELFARLDAAMKASWDRTDPRKEQAA